MVLGSSHLPNWCGLMWRRCPKSAWSSRGPLRASPVRNEKIIAAADEVVAFWDGRSRGTLNALCLAKEKGIAISIFDEAGKPVSLEVAMQAAKELGVIDALDAARSRTFGGR